MRTPFYKKKNILMAQGGFTLIELMVALALGFRLID